MSETHSWKKSKYTIFDHNAHFIIKILDTSKTEYDYLYTYASTQMVVMTETLISIHYFSI